MSETADVGEKSPEPAKTESGSVSSSQYIGVKEMLRKSEERETNLQSQLADKAVEVLRIKTELGSLNEQLAKQPKDAVPQSVYDALAAELVGFKTKEFEIRKTSLSTTYGFKPEVFEGMDTTQLDTFEKILKSKAGEETTKTVTTPDVSAVLGKSPPKADLSGGGGTAPMTPMESMLAQLRIAKAEKGIKV